jgi:hypothetical protein
MLSDFDTRALLLYNSCVLRFTLILCGEILVSRVREFALINFRRRIRCEILSKVYGETVIYRDVLSKMHRM